MEEKEGKSEQIVSRSILSQARKPTNIWWVFSFLFGIPE